MVKQIVIKPWLTLINPDLNHDMNRDMNHDKGLKHVKHMVNHHHVG